MSNSKQAVQLVWFKRDLRVRDHLPLFKAASAGPVLPLYITEPSLHHAPDFDSAHWTFIARSLQDLQHNLEHLGQTLVIRIGEVIPELEKLRRFVDIAAIWTHEETGNGLTYARDVAVRRWARANGIALHELPQSGVIRGRQHRRGWDEAWERYYSQPQIPIPQLLKPVNIVAGRIPTREQLRLPRDGRSMAQKGGETIGRRLLDTFLEHRGQLYLRDISSPITAATSGSRLSPHLAYGTISGREVVQSVRQRLNALRKPPAGLDPGELRQWRRALRAFESRLHWRDHFVQKLETEPLIESQNMVRAFDNRFGEINQAHFDAWRSGSTGYPLVDACMRSLHKTGWLNFRMRALVVSFAAHDLGLHWREPALYLARCFVDYEPGIHYCQMQMQSGTSGNATLRIYNPTTQAREQDPDGSFIRQWVPELRALASDHIHTPWQMPLWSRKEQGVVIGVDYPYPIVEHTPAARRARQKISQILKQPATIAEIAALRQRHNTERDAANGPARSAGRTRQSGPQLRLFD